MRNAQEVHDADQNERFREELKARKVASANRADRSKKRSGRTPNRALRFSDLEASGERISSVRELAAPRDSWLKLESEH